jgi:peptidoglycan/xylan/chitin deacetylase (PgdA/CDA1 family)
MTDATRREVSKSGKAGIARWLGSGTFLLGFVLLTPGPARAGSSQPVAAAKAGRKLIALTFDDGPKPYVLFGKKTASGMSSSSLLDLLNREGVHATFFVMGWRLSENADKFCLKEGGVTCREAVALEHQQGDEIENHTYGHGDFRKMERRYGDAWILNDIDRCSGIIQSITDVRPHDVRPPDWDIWPALEKQIEARGYRVMSKSPSVPPALRDVDSEDYFCAGPSQPHCPKQGLDAYVLDRIGRREKEGIYDHILAFHELPITVKVLGQLIQQLKQRGYRFVLLQAYLSDVSETAR